MHTNWARSAYDGATGCEVTHIYPPTHPYIGNTVESIDAAFRAGATMVELDFRPSADGVLMLNRDEDLAARPMDTASSPTTRPLN